MSGWRLGRNHLVFLLQVLGVGAGVCVGLAAVGRVDPNRMVRTLTGARLAIEPAAPSHPGSANQRFVELGLRNRSLVPIEVCGIHMTCDLAVDRGAMPFRIAAGERRVLRLRKSVEAGAPAEEFRLSLLTDNANQRFIHLKLDYEPSQSEYAVVPLP